MRKLLSKLPEVGRHLFFFVAMIIWYIKFGRWEDWDTEGLPVASLPLIGAVATLVLYHLMEYLVDKQNLRFLVFPDALFHAAYLLATFVVPYLALILWLEGIKVLPTLALLLIYLFLLSILFQVAIVVWTKSFRGKVVTSTMALVVIVGTQVFPPSQLIHSVPQLHSLQLIYKYFPAA